MGKPNVVHEACGRVAFESATECHPIALGAPWIPPPTAERCPACGRFLVTLAPGSVVTPRQGKEP